MDRVELFVDGACRGNPGPGGWGVLLRFQGKERELSGGELNTTNNRMELMAAIQGLNSLKRPCQIVVFTDSEYVKNGITRWIHTWQAKGWKNSAGKPVKNQDLWQQLFDAVSRHEIEWRWVKGHSDHPENDRVDALAKSGVDIALAFQDSAIKSNGN